MGSYNTSEGGTDISKKLKQSRKGFEVWKLWLKKKKETTTK